MPRKTKKQKKSEDRFWKYVLLIKTVVWIIIFVMLFIAVRKMIGLFE
jgi:hypothetical protein